MDYIQKLMLYLRARCWKNFGHVHGSVYRSGQMSKFFLERTHKKYKFKCIIALNMDGSSKDEEFEVEFCKKQGINHLQYNWSASKNSHPDQLLNALFLIEDCHLRNFPVLIHCAGGKDRTGGLIGHWMMNYKHITIAEFVEQMHRHKIPDEGWLKSVFETTKG